MPFIPFMAKEKKKQKQKTSTKKRERQNKWDNGKKIVAQWHSSNL